MTLREMKSIVSSHSMELVGEYAGMTTGDIMRADGLDDVEARVFHDLAEVYYGHTHASHQQAQARTRAIDKHHTIATLREIESQVRKLHDKSHAWQVRVALTTCRPNCREIRAEAIGVLARFNTMRATNPTNSLSCRPIPGTTKMRVSVVADAHTARLAVDKARQIAKAQDSDEADEFLTAAASSGSGQLPAVEPAIILPADTTIMGTTMDERGNYMLSLTDGTTVTAQEFSQMKLTEYGWAVLLEPMTGKELGVYRFRTDTARFADPFQRKLQRLKTPVCAVEGCTCGADNCQVHHIQPFKDGGPTVMDNFSLLCGFHNGRNDDDPKKPRYGRIEKITGLDYYVPPYGGRPRLNMTPCAQGGAVRLAQKMVGHQPQAVL